jgi:phosphohistidine phosphatase SixA
MSPAWRWRAAAVLIAAGVTGAAAMIVNEPATVVLLVRHAEKAAEPVSDPPLTEAGQQRAAALARVAKHAGVTAIYATQYRRTQQTVKPVAAESGIVPRTLKASEVDELVSELQSLRGATILVAGHTNTLPRIVEKLGGGHVAPIPESDYGNLFVVVIRKWSGARVVRLHYGDPS